MTRIRAAFTLIELLIVIAIIAILAAITFPVFAQARERVRQSGCLSNMRQAAISVLMYAQDFDETLPPSTNYGTPDRPIWTAMVQPYLKSFAVFLCPSAPGSDLPLNWSRRGYASIGYTSQTAYDPEASEGFMTTAPLPRIEEPARTPLFADTPNAVSGGPMGKYRGYTFDPCVRGSRINTTDPRLSTPLVSDRDLVAELGSGLPPSQLKPVHARHFSTGRDTGFATILLADGHVRVFSAAAILAQERGANLLWRFRGCPSQ